MNVLVACEFSGVVRDAFIKKGHNAWSCDLLPTETPGPHLQCDVLEVAFFPKWDLVIAHPPCTCLASSGAAWFQKKRQDGTQQAAMKFFMMFTKLGCKWCIENPIGVMSTHYRKPDQTIQPYQFGHSVKKTTCLWLNGLPPLQPTTIVEPEIVTLSTGAKFSKWDYEISSNKKDRAKLRSKTFTGIAQAMADQWG